MGMEELLPSAVPPSDRTDMGILLYEYAQKITDERNILLREVRTLQNRVEILERAMRRGR